MKVCIVVVIGIACTTSFALKAQDARTVESPAERGKMVYEQTCLPCHQADGSGVPNLAPPLIKGIFVNGDKKRLITILLQGLQDVEINGEYYANPMPAVDYLSDQEIADVLTYVRSHFSNDASPVHATEVMETRKTKQ